MPRSIKSIERVKSSEADIAEDGKPSLSVTTLFVLLYGVCLIILFITTLKEMLLIVFVFLSFCLWACFCIGISYIFVPLISLSLPLKCNCIFSKRLLHFNYVSNIRL
uniref:Uncharacterized protein n=1 Tax=Pundamilia nyererei TaxID=303518 RepID=A0A3B4GF24_9CICH